MQMNFRRKRPVLVINHKSQSVVEEIVQTVYDAEPGQNILCYPAVRNAAEMPLKIKDKVQELVDKRIVWVLLRRSSELTQHGHRTFDIILQKRRSD